MVKDKKEEFCKSIQAFLVCITRYFLLIVLMLLLLSNIVVFLFYSSKYCFLPYHLLANPLNYIVLAMNFIVFIFLINDRAFKSLKHKVIAIFVEIIAGGTLIIVLPVMSQLSCIMSFGAIIYIEIKTCMNISKIIQNNVICIKLKKMICLIIMKLIAAQPLSMVVQEMSQDATIYLQLVSILIAVYEISVFIFIYKTFIKFEASNK